MIKKFIWKFFPPREITDSEIECALNAFENSRKYVQIPSNSVFKLNYYNYEQQTFEYLNKLVRKQKEYSEYVSYINNKKVDHN